VSCDGLNRETLLFIIDVTKVSRYSVRMNVISKQVISHDDDNETDDNSNNNDGNKLNSKDKNRQGLNAIFTVHQCSNVTTIMVMVMKTVIYNLKFKRRLNSIKYSLASSHVRWLNGE
jgi:hypothetical protein